jgi:hypothetical protein
MSLLPESTQLGKLEIIEVYEYYDVPCLFACRNASEQIFLAVWASQTKEMGKWLYVPMSIGRFQRVRSGNIDIRDAFLTAEDGFVYEVIIPGDDSFDRVIAVSCQEINDEWLPVAGELLDFDSEPLPALLLQKQEVK